MLKTPKSRLSRFNVKFGYESHKSGKRSQKVKLSIPAVPLVRSLSQGGRKGLKRTWRSCPEHHARIVLASTIVGLVPLAILDAVGTIGPQNVEKRRNKKIARLIRTKDPPPDSWLSSSTKEADSYITTCSLSANDEDNSFTRDSYEESELSIVTCSREGKI